MPAHFCYVLIRSFKGWLFEQVLAQALEARSGAGLGSGTRLAGSLLVAHADTSAPAAGTDADAADAAVTAAPAAAGAADAGACASDAGAFPVNMFLKSRISRAMERKLLMVSAFSL